MLNKQLRKNKKLIFLFLNLFIQTKKLCNKNELKKIKKSLFIR